MQLLFLFVEHFHDISFNAIRLIEVDWLFFEKRKQISHLSYSDSGQDKAVTEHGKSATQL